MKTDIICPCCNKKIQLILSDIGIGDTKVTGVFFNEENDDDNIKQEDLEKELFEKLNILLG